MMLEAREGRTEVEGKIGVHYGRGIVIDWRAIIYEEFSRVRYFAMLAAVRVIVYVCVCVCVCVCVRVCVCVCVCLPCP